MNWVYAFSSTGIFWTSTQDFACTLRRSTDCDRPNRDTRLIVHDFPTGTAYAVIVNALSAIRYPTAGN